MFDFLNSYLFDEFEIFFSSNTSILSEGSFDFLIYMMSSLPNKLMLYLLQISHNKSGWDVVLIFELMK